MSVGERKLWSQLKWCRDIQRQSRGDRRVSHTVGGATLGAPTRLPSGSAERDATNKRAAAWRRSGRVIALYTVLAVVSTFPLALHLADGLVAAPDTLLHTWILAWDVHAALSNPLHLYDANVYYPFPLPLTYSDAMLSGAVLIAPVLLFTNNPVLAHNVLTLLALVMTAAAMYWLVRDLTQNDFGSIIAGCIFGFCASRQAHLEHVNLLQFAWLPLGLLFLRRGMRSGKSWDFGLFALFSVGEALASIYLGFMMATAYFISIPAEFIAHPAARTRKHIAHVIVSLAVVGVVVLPLMLPYWQTQQIYHFLWPMDVVRDLSAVPSDYLSPAPQNLLFQQILSRFNSANYPTEHALFPGFFALALAIFGATRRPISPEIARYSLIGIVAFVLSFGPFGLSHGDSQGVALPYWYLWQFLPGFTAMRVPARFDFLVMLAVAVLAGFGAARLSAVFARRTERQSRKWVPIIVLVLTLIEIVPQPRPVNITPVGDNVPPVYRWLANQDQNAVVAEMPTSGPMDPATFRYEYLSTYHWHALVNGSSGFEPPAAKEVASQISGFPSPTAIEHLRSLGVRYVVVHRDDLDDNARQNLDHADLAQLQVTVASTFGPDVVFDIGPPSAPAPLVDEVQFEFPSVVGHASTPSVNVSFSNTTSNPLFVGATKAVWAQVAWNGRSFGEPIRLDLPVFIEPTNRVSLQVPAPIPAEIGAADSAQLSIRLSGPFDLENSQTVHFTDLPTSAGKAGLSGRLEQVHVPQTVRAGTSIAVEVTARNLGQAVWLPDPPGTTGTHGVVGVSVRAWIAADGTSRAPSENSTAHVTFEVNPGQETTLALRTRAPAAPGNYTLELDMLSENVTWFEDVNGGTRTTVPILVEP